MLWGEITKEFFCFHDWFALHIVIVNYRKVLDFNILLLFDHFFRGFLLLNILGWFFISKESKKISSICWDWFFWIFGHWFDMKSLRKYSALLKALDWFFVYNIFLYQQLLSSNKISISIFEKKKNILQII